MEKSGGGETRTLKLEDNGDTRVFIMDLTLTNKNAYPRPRRQHEATHCAHPPR